MTQRGLALNFVVSNDGTQTLVTSTDAANAQASGAGWVRIDLHLGGKTSWDAQIIASYTAAINLFTATGLKVLGILGPGIVAGATQSQWNQNAKELGGSGSNGFISAYTAAAKQVVSAFPHVSAWEVWNEPNAWQSHPSATVYTGGSYIYPSILAALLTKACPAIKAIAPHCTIVTGGLLAHNNNGVVSWDNSGATYLHDLYAAGVWWGVPDPFDAVGLHFYINQAGALDPAVLGTYLDQYVATLGWAEGRTSALSKPCWITEFGWSTGAPAGQTPPVSEQQQAANVAALLAQVAEHPWIAVAMNFEERDNPGGAEWYGLYRSDWSAKPALVAFQQA